MHSSTCKVMADFLSSSHRSLPSVGCAMPRVWAPDVAQRTQLFRNGHWTTIHMVLDGQPSTWCWMMTLSKCKQSAQYASVVAGSNTTVNVPGGGVAVRGDVDVRAGDGRGYTIASARVSVRRRRNTTQPACFRASTDRIKPLPATMKMTPWHSS